MQLLYQFIYNPLVNRIITGVLKSLPRIPEKFRIPPSGIISLTLKNKKTIKLCTNQTCHVTYEVFWKGTSSYEYSDIFEKLFERCRVFFDVGSNIGYYSIMAGKTNPNIRVYAFDPSPGPFAYLSKNILINKLTNVFAFQTALSNQSGTFSFYVAENPKYTYLKYNSLGGSGHLEGTRMESNRKTVTVNALTMDDFVKAHKISEIDLIKLDVEEAEHLVLEGAKSVLKNFRPIVVSEIFSTDLLLQVLQMWDITSYVVYIFSEGKLHAVDPSKRMEIQQIENFFFVPVEKKEWVSEFIAYEEKTEL